MERFKIISSDKTYILSNNTLYGEFFIQIGSYCFPYDFWEDLVGSCLDMWLSSLSELCRGAIGVETRFYFMDGPYYFVARKQSNNIIELLFYSRDIFTIKKIIRLYDFIEEIVGATKNVLRYRPIDYNYNSLNKKLKDII